VPQALGNLMLSHAHLQQADQALAVANDLGARFAADPRAPANILQLAKFYDDQGDAGEAAAVKIYNLYLKLFPKHGPRTECALPAGLPAQTRPRSPRPR